MRFLVFILRIVMVLSVTFGLMCLLWIHRTGMGSSEELGFRYRRIWARWTGRIIGLRIHQIPSNEKYEKCALYVSNHRAITDPVVQIQFFKAYIIAKAEVGTVPIIGKGAEMTGILFVQRNKIQSRVNARVETTSLLAKGKNVLVYPEGTTTINRTTTRFNTGTFNAAIEARVPVIPVAVEYRNKKDYWNDRNLFSQLLNQIGSWKTEVRISVGRPIYDAQADRLLLKTKKWIDNELLQMQEGWSNVFD